MEFMNIRELKNDYEILNNDIFIFTFYDFEIMFDFLTEDMNCMTSNSRMHLVKWFYQGICTDLISLHTKNRDLFYSLSFQSTCVLCNHCQIVDREDEDCPCIVKMNPLKHKIIIEYSYYEILNEFIVYFRIPMVCNLCINPPLLLIQCHDELMYYVKKYQEYCALICCKSINCLDSYTLCEPFLKRYILHFLP